MRMEKNFARELIVLVIVNCILVLAISNAAVANADDAGFTAEKLQDANEYITFIDLKPVTRMDSDGYFEFLVRWSLLSDTFVANSNTITIQTIAEVKNIATGYSYTDDSLPVSLVLYNSGGGVVGSYTGYADGIYGGLAFSVTSGASYRFKIFAPTTSLPHNCYLSGHGYVIPVAVS